MADRELVLKCEKGIFTDESKKASVEYVSFYVEVAGLKLKMKPADNTAKQLLEQFYGFSKR